LTYRALLLYYSLEESWEVKENCRFLQTNGNLNGLCLKWAWWSFRELCWIWNRCRITQKCKRCVYADAIFRSVAQRISGVPVCLLKDWQKCSWNWGCLVTL